MKVYISGKVTGLQYEKAWMNFQEVEERLTEEGYDVVNPLKNGVDPDDTWESHMREDIKLLMDCDAIYLMNNWEISKGAQIEQSLAESLGYVLIKQEEFNNQ